MTEPQMFRLMENVILAALSERNIQPNDAEISFELPRGVVTFKRADLVKALGYFAKKYYPPVYINIPLSPELAAELQRLYPE